MNDAKIATYTSLFDLKRLPNSNRMSAAKEKYSAAVKLYAVSNLPLCKVAEICCVTPAGLSAHISRYHRSLLYNRYNLDSTLYDAKNLKVKPPKGQSLKTHLKYKDAIEACGDIAYIEFNVSQVAHMFNLDGPALAAQLRFHYPDIIPNREHLRQQLGIADNTHRGPRSASVQEYELALDMYRNTDLTINQVAEKCNVSKGGFSQFMRFYHHDVIAEKSARRKEAKRNSGSRKAGTLSGSGKLYGPSAETIQLYAPALNLFRTTNKTVSEIIAETGVPADGFKCYLHQWHRGDKLIRRGFDWDGETVPMLKETPRFLKSTNAKYADAIASLKSNPRPIAEVAAEFGLNADVFRQYLKTHQPQLAAMQGMIRLSGGKLVKRSSYEKYRAAIEEYATSADTLKNIAQRHGIVYHSLMGFVLRNCPEERESHQKILEQNQIETEKR